MITSSHFLKNKSRPKGRNVRSRRLDSEDEAAESNSPTAPDRLNAHPDLEQLQSQMAKIRDRKKKSSGLKAATAQSQSRADWEEDEDSQNSVDKKKSTQLLSFGAEEEEGDVFQVKKSSQSRRIMKQKKAERKSKTRAKKSSDDSETEDPPEEPALPRLPRLPRSQRNVIEPELDLRLKDNLPQHGPASVWVLSGREAEAMHMEADDRNSDGASPGSDAEAHRAQAEDPIRHILNSGVIPDATAIYRAKKKRQLARETGPTAPLPRDYIPINARSPPADRNGTPRGGRSRLVREGESDEDEDGRIAFTVQRESRPHTGGSTHAESEEEDDEDQQDAWERQQYRKVLGSNALSAQDQAYYTDRGFFMNTGAGQEPEIKPNNVFPGEAIKVPASFNLPGIKASLKERLESLSEVHRRHQRDADQSVDSLVTSQAEIEKLEVQVPELEKRYQFFQDLRGYMVNLIECFNEKMTNIQYLEEKFTKSKGEVSSSIMDRRREDIRDQIIELASKPAQIDENSEVQRRKRAAEREGRRRRRQQQRLCSQSHLTAKHNEGMSSDDELSTTDQAALRKVRQDVENQARQVLGDVVEEFSTLGGIKRMMEDWKAKDPASYSDAYVSLCLPKIFSPLVRLQLLFWNPFAEHNEINQMEWYRSLATFSYSQDESLSSLTTDRDKKLLSLMVEKVVVPKLTSVIKVCYDPLSTTQTLRCVGILTRFLNDYPTLNGQSKLLRECLKEVQEKLKVAVDKDVYIPIGYSKQVSENSLSPHALFVNRQFWGCYKLLRNILSWQGILGDRLLSDLAIQSILTKFLVIGLGMNPDPMDALTKSRHLVACLPTPWRETGVFKEDLQRFAQYLVTLSQKSLGPEGIRSIAEMLKMLNYQTESDTIKRTRL
eukprot:maker-scaffold559_size137194-snap-gene-0.25 protein:Tk04616 transcript:maker-scaffold559_size137194-snap-gene-0.25-mRNA-1 annotation:"pax3- and pax7-binding protein 1 isoform x1"